jgi:hypothetical protein
VQFIATFDPHLDSIVARALLVADFIDSIDPKRTRRTSKLPVDLISVPSGAG